MPQDTEPTRLAIVGCRDADMPLVRNSLEDCWEMEYACFVGGCVIGTGDANGVDRVAREFARDWEIPLTIFRADWKAHGRSAGPLRNAQIVEWCTFCLAFWDGVSPGTLNTITQMVKAGKYVQIVSLHNLRRIAEEKAMELIG